MNPHIHKGLMKALTTVIASLAPDVRKQLRGRWRWRIAPLWDQDGRTVGHTSPSNLVTFDPEFAEAVLDLDDESSLEALCCHEIGHVLRNIWGVAGPDIDGEERAVNQWMEARGFGHDLRRLKRFSGYEKG